MLLIQGRPRGEQHARGAVSRSRGRPALPQLGLDGGPASVNSAAGSSSPDSWSAMARNAAPVAARAAGSSPHARVTQ